MYEPLVYLLFLNFNLFFGMAGKLRSERITTEGILSRKLTLENHILENYTGRRSLQTNRQLA